MLSKNLDMLDFVLEYPNKKGAEYQNIKLVIYGHFKPYRNKRKVDIT